MCGSTADVDLDVLSRRDLDAEQRLRAGRGWALRQRLGRPLNILRLLKAAFTFEGAMDYVAWKIRTPSWRAD